MQTQRIILGRLNLCGNALQRNLMSEIFYFLVGWTRKLFDILKIETAWQRQIYTECLRYSGQRLKC